MIKIFAVVFVKENPLWPQSKAKGFTITIKAIKIIKKQFYLHKSYVLIIT